MLHTFKVSCFNFARVDVGHHRLTARVTDDVKTTRSEPVFHFDDIRDAGWILITEVGDENLYFQFRDNEGDVHTGYCKTL